MYFQCMVQSFSLCLVVLTTQQIRHERVLPGEPVAMVCSLVRVDGSAHRDGLKMYALIVNEIIEEFQYAYNM
jgi:hypothetical protein